MRVKYILNEESLMYDDTLKEFDSIKHKDIKLPENGELKVYQEDNTFRVALKKVNSEGDVTYTITDKGSKTETIEYLCHYMEQPKAVKFIRELSEMA